MGSIYQSDDRFSISGCS